MLVRRMNSPTRVIRGSCRSFCDCCHSVRRASSSFISFCSTRSASGTMERNLRQSNTSPFCPTRRWRNSAGPPDRRTSTKITASSGSKAIKTVADTRMSTVLLATMAGSTAETPGDTATCGAARARTAAPELLWYCMNVNPELKGKSWPLRHRRYAVPSGIQKCESGVEAASRASVAFRSRGSGPGRSVCKRATAGRRP